MTAPTASQTTQPVPETSQAAQAAVAVAIGLAITKLWPSLDVAHLRRSLPGFKAAVAVEVQRHAQASAALAARQYQQQRVAAVGAGGYTPVPASPPPIAQIAQVVDWAVQPLWNSNVQAYLLGAPEAEPTDTLPSAATAIADAKARLAASSERLVLDAGASTIVENAALDQKARGYARIPEAGACSLCLMLASRGAVYKYDRAGRVANGRGRIAKGVRHMDGDSFAASNARFTGDGTVKIHDHCQCHPEPVFGVYEMSARARAAEQLWIVAAKGRSGKSARDAYRAAVDGVTNDKTGTPYFTDEQAAHIADLRPLLR